MRQKPKACFLKVHGGIRHLETAIFSKKNDGMVHGGIRHLEIHVVRAVSLFVVHGGIRHLEN